MVARLGRWSLTVCALLGCVTLGQAQGVVEPPVFARPVVPEGGFSSVGAPQSEAERAILRALEQPLAGGIHDVKLSDLPALLREKLKIAVGLDHQALADAAVPTDFVLNGPMGTASARGTLHVALRAADLGWTVEDNLLLISTKSALEGREIVKTYDVADLVWPEENERVDFESLELLILGLITPESWPDGTGPGPIRGVQADGVCAIVVPQIGEIHEQIERLLGALRQAQSAQQAQAARAEKSSATDKPAAGSPTADSPTEQPRSFGLNPHEPVMLAALAKPFDFELRDVPIRDLPKLLSDKLGMAVALEGPVLAEKHIDLNARVSCHSEGVTRQRALDHALAERELTWILQDDVLVLTAEAPAEARCTIRVYDVSDLVKSASDGRPDYSLLEDALLVGPIGSSWADRGYGSMGYWQPYSTGDLRVLVVSQTRAVHEQIESLWAGIRAQKHPAQAIRTSQTRVQAIRRALATPITVDLTDVPLDQALASFRESWKINIVIDVRGFAEAAEPVDRPVTCHVRDLPARDALELMLRPMDLTWVIRNDVLFITTRSAADNVLETRVYNVTDLVRRRRTSASNFDTLIDTMTRNIEPPSWSEVGGIGAISPWSSDGVSALVISQTWSAHEKIEHLLAELRRQQVQTGGMGGGFSVSTQGLPVAADGDSLPDLPDDPARDAFVEGSNQFALELYAQLARQPKSKNLVCSPCSLATALSMLSAGARGDTYDELARTLHYTVPPTKVPGMVHRLLGTLPADDRHGYELRVANHLWGQQDFEFHPEYLTLIKEQFGGGIDAVDFVGARDEACTTINAWVAEQTRGRIPTIISRDSIKPLTRLVLTNAVYFKGKWSEPFAKQLTESRPFFAPAQSVNCPLMFQQQKHAYAEVDNVQILEKPYEGDALTMLILLPPNEKGALERLEQSLTAKQLQQYLAELRTCEVKLTLPRFKFDASFSLPETLQSLGVRKAFTTDADLSGITSVAPQWIQEVIHKADIEVEEQGTVAAAATTIQGAFGAMADEPQVVEFRADHPFVFLIRDTRTGSILFIGRLLEPEAVAAPAG